MAYSRKCYYCDERVSWRELHVDHFIPDHTDKNLKQEILNELNLDHNLDFNGLINLVPAHTSCNTARKGKYIPSAISFSGALVITEKHLPKILEIKERLDNEENYDDDIAKLAYHLEKGYITPEGLYDYLINDDQSFDEIEDLNSVPVRVSTKNVMIQCYLPKFSEIHGSMMIAFRSLHIRGCFITFSHREIVDILFQGIGSPPSERFRSFIVGTEIMEDNCIVQLGNNRLIITQDEARQLCNLIDKIAPKYLSTVRLVESIYRSSMFEYSQNNRFRLLKISRLLWRNILEFTKEFDYEKGDTEWHIFDGKASYLKVLCETPEDSNRNYRVFIYPEAEENIFWESFIHAEDEVWLCWDPSILINSEEDITKFKDNIFWTAEYSYLWLKTKLIPRVNEYIKQKTSFLGKAFNGSHKYEPFDKLEIADLECNTKNFSEIKDLETLKNCVDEFQHFFAIHSSHFLTNNALKGIYKAIILCLKHFRLGKGRLGYINNKLGGNQKLEGIFAIVEQKLDELEYGDGVNGSNVEYTLRSLCAILREGDLASDENTILNKIIPHLEMLSEEFSLLSSLERARLL